MSPAVAAASGVKEPASDRDQRRGRPYVAERMEDLGETG